MSETTESCPATSPLSDAPCALPDVPAEHCAGHQSRTLPGTVTKVAWATTDADHARWGADP